LYRAFPISARGKEYKCSQFPAIEFYDPHAFAAFIPTSELNLGTARALMWASQLAYELDTGTSDEQVDKVKTILLGGLLNPSPELIRQPFLDALIELSPERIRQHLQDQYIAALRA
jgi:hypothetical protein